MDHSRIKVTEQNVVQRVMLIRGRRVMVDSDLAELYGVSTKVLNQAVKRNIKRFPEDFMFRLTLKERLEVVTNCDHLFKLKFSPVLPSVFTEHGALMLASVLNSKRAIEMSMTVIRVFVKLREMLAAHKDLSARLEKLESRVGDHDEDIGEILSAVRRLLSPPVLPAKPRIGFHP